MSNPHATGMVAARVRGLTVRTRKCILDVFDLLDDRKTPMAELLATAAVKDPLKFMDTASKFIIKDLQIDINHMHNPSMLTDDEIAEEIATRARARLEQARDITDQVEVIDTGVSKEAGVSK